MKPEDFWEAFFLASHTEQKNLRKYSTKNSYRKHCVHQDWINSEKIRLKVRIPPFPWGNFGMRTPNHRSKILHNQISLSWDLIRIASTGYRWKGPSLSLAFIPAPFVSQYQLLRVVFRRSHGSCDVTSLCSRWPQNVTLVVQLLSFCLTIVFHLSWISGRFSWVAFYDD